MVDLWWIDRCSQHFPAINLHFSLGNVLISFRRRRHLGHLPHLPHLPEHSSGHSSQAGRHDTNLQVLKSGNGMKIYIYIYIMIYIYYIILYYIIYIYILLLNYVATYLYRAKFVDVLANCDLKSFERKRPNDMFPF